MSYCLLLEQIAVGGGSRTTIMRQWLLPIFLISSAVALKVESQQDEDAVDRLGQARIKPLRYAKIN